MRLICLDILQIDVPSSIHPSSEKTMNEDQSKAFERNFPENLGSVNTPVTPQVCYIISILLDQLFSLLKKKKMSLLVSHYYLVPDLCYNKSTRCRVITSWNCSPRNRFIFTKIMGKT